MINKVRLSLSEVLINPQIRSFFVIGGLIAAVLVGAAPSDFGGGGGV